MTSIVLYCRPGFEKECGAEIQEKASWNEMYGYLEQYKNNPKIEIFKATEVDKSHQAFYNLYFLLS